jgi:predicted MFS family arabinose efflux permease
MTTQQTAPDTGAGPRRLRLHRAWIVAGVTFLALVAAAAFRSSTGVLIEPVEDEFGWPRSGTSAAVSINLLLFGLTSPFAAALMERFGPRRVVAVALGAVAAGTGLTLLMTELWQLILLWGFVVGLGTGSMALVFGAIVAGRWFEARRGLVMGVFSAGSATGQLIVLPPVAYLAANLGWRWAAGVTTVLALALVPLVLALLRDRPADVGQLPYGATSPPPAAERSGAPSALGILAGVYRVPAFWVLAGTFFICGWSTNGLIQTHLVPAAHDHGMPATTAASLLALIGIFDIVGTVASGWLSDRFDARILLLAYYGLRGLSLLVVPTVMGATVDPPLMLFIVFYGLDWVATVPPTVVLCRQWFGPVRAGVVFGWVFAAHMVGGGIAAGLAGFMRDATGSYTSSWFTAGALCLVAAMSIMLLPRVREDRVHSGASS